MRLLHDAAVVITALTALLFSTAAIFGAPLVIFIFTNGGL